MLCQYYVLFYGCCKCRPTFRQIDVLAFLSIEDIPEGILYIHDNTTEDLVDYFNQTHITGTFHCACVPQAGLDGAAIVRMKRIPPRY